MKISFIMPVRNEEKFITTAIASLQKVSDFDWELIVIDDHSNDNTEKIVNEIGSMDKRVKYSKNDKKGKVCGLNLGYSISTGDIIKCIDGDDVLHPSFFQYIKLHNKFDVLCHNYAIVNENLDYLTSYKLNRSYFNASAKVVVERIISLPRCVWSFKRSLAEKIFPMPEALPFEDVWFSMIIKCFARSIYHIEIDLYAYRQHTGQTYRGILNFSKDAIHFRTRRLLTLTKVLQDNIDRLGFEHAPTFELINEYNSRVINEEKIFPLPSFQWPGYLISRFLIFTYFRPLLPYISMFQWKLRGFGKKNQQVNFLV